jgi:tRNA G37 N-methylase Trm5
VYNYSAILSQLETSYVIVGALVAVDTPRQIGWHLDNARRGGASLEQARAVRQIAMEASESAGVRRRNDVPEVKA